MARDLVTPADEVHRAAEILHFWLEDTPADRRFVHDPELDETIRRRFAGLRESVLESNARGWRGSPRDLLAAIILLDQFSRNLLRDDARAYAADPLCRSLSREALAKGWDEALDAASQQFLYMPLMHSERMADQVAALRLYARVGLPEALDFCRRHAGQIARFGRFPQRNDALGRATTAAESAFLSGPDARF